MVKKSIKRRTKEVTLMRNRGSVVIIENNRVALIQRNRDGAFYYVFPGGGIERGETPEEGAKREAYEELGVHVKIHECIAKVAYNGMQYFFLAEIKEGIFGNGQGEEFTDNVQDRGTYLPMWVEISNLSSLDVRPREAISSFS